MKLSIITIMLQSDALDILGQVPFLYKLYTQICSVYPTTDPASHDDIVSTLRTGLDRLGESFPWLTGQIIHEGASEGNTGVYKFAYLDRIPLVVKDLRHDTSAPAMSALRQADFPFKMLDENVIAPCATLNLPGSTIGLAANSAPVFAVQINFIAGGCILTVVGQHNVMDMTGQGQIMYLLSKACHNKPFTSEELEMENMDRSKAISLLDDSYEPGPELACQIVRPSPDIDNEPPPTTSPPKCTWAYLSFSPSSLKALKSLAVNNMPPSSGFISTDDTVSAFIWQCISRARIPRLEPSAHSTFRRAVDVRQHLGIPPTYPGLMQNMTYNTATLQHLVEEPLGATASKLRLQLDPQIVDLAYNTRALVTFLARSPDKTKAGFTANADTATDFALSSWAKVDLYGLDFNMGLGKPEAVRRPCFIPFDGLGYLMPRSPRGEMVAGICIRDENWEGLRVDEEFMKYATYIG